MEDRAAGLAELETFGFWGHDNSSPLRLRRGERTNTAWKSKKNVSQPNMSQPFGSVAPRAKWREMDMAAKLWGGRTWRSSKPADRRASRRGFGFLVAGIVHESAHSRHQRSFTPSVGAGELCKMARKISSFSLK